MQGEEQAKENNNKKNTMKKQKNRKGNNGNLGSIDFSRDCLITWHIIPP